MSRGVIGEDKLGIIKETPGPASARVDSGRDRPRRKGGINPRINLGG